jgi:1-acyl-sn-glycerol-3-phosphate acyltransferase
MRQPPALAGGTLRGTPGGMPSIARYGTVPSDSEAHGNGKTTNSYLNGSLGKLPIPSGGDHAADRDQSASDPPEQAGEWRGRIAEALEFTRRQMAGGNEADEFGFDPEFNSRVLMPVARALYQHWFRVRMKGLNHVPGEGSAAMVVANHSGVLPVDAIMLQSGLHDEHPGHRNLRLLGADLVYELPVLSQLARKGGHTRASPSGAHQLLSSGELVGVFPEGFRGIGKPFNERYRLQRFGRGGFAASAIRARVPIIPCAIVGAEEIFPMIGNAKPLARLLRLPYFPITPLFPWLGLVGAIPLPSQWIIEFCPPVPTDGHPAGAEEDPAVIAELTATVRDTIQRKLDQLLVERGPAFP